MHITEHELERYFATGTFDQNTDQLLKLQAHLSECDDCRKRLVEADPNTVDVSVHSDSSEKRREPRIPTHQLGILRLPSTLERFGIEVLDVSRNGLRIRTPRFLSRGAVVVVDIRETVIQGEVRYCVEKDDGFQVGLYIRECVERRSQQRSAVDIPAMIGEVKNDTPATIVDRSDTGLLLAAHHQIAKGTAVRIVAEGTLSYGSVVHCRREGEEFKIGVKIDYTQHDMS